MQPTYPLVSIGIPTYNRADSYLPDALESSLKQTYPNVEIVVSDNGSSDSTESVVSAYADPRVQYYRQNPPLSPNDNFNFCLQQASGDYFLLLHDDDMIDADFVDTCLSAANFSTRYGILRTGTRTIDADRNVIKHRPNQAVGFSTAEFILAWFEHKTALYLCSTLFNTERLKDLGGFHTKHNLFQDVVAMITLAARHGRVDMLEIKASYRKHPDTRTFAAQISDWCEDGLIVMHTIYNEISEKREQLQDQGRRYMAGVNYNFASRISRPFDRYRAYLMVYRMFDYQYSPLAFIASRSKKFLSRQFRRVRRKMKFVLDEG